ncbi:MAG: DUF805 domain-containing protein [Pseudomonadota bacterium]|nr:DUF805 domain-containing protein [Pseudomonadota bacterium]
MEWMILPFKRYADFQGRSRRKEFWMFALLNIIIGLVLAGPFYFSMVGSAVEAAAAGASEDAAAAAALGGAGMFSMVGIGLYGLYALAALIPNIAVTVRRFHDRDMSGWWYLGFIVASMIPFVGILASIALIVILALPGTDGANRFGPDPKNPYQEDVFA